MPKPRKSRARTLVASSLLLLGSGCAYAGSGDLDPTFGNGGIGQGSAILDEQGRSYTLGFTTGACPGVTCSVAVLKRSTADGLPDSSFGTGGALTTDQPAGSILRRLPDGTFRIFWSYFHFLGGGSYTDYGVYKLLADGSEDPSFQSPAYVSYRDFAWPASRSRLDIFPDQRFLFANHRWLARHLANGNIDPAFNGGAPVAARYETFFWNTAAVLPDGGALLTGFRPVTTAPDEILRMLPNGARDPSFGNAGGVALSPAGVPVNALSLLRLGDGKLVILLASAPAENAPRHLEVRRYTATGQLDTTFGTGGSTLLPAVAAFDYNDTSPQPDLLATDAQGRIIVGGTDIGMGTPRMFVARLLAEGAIDGSFGNDGVTYLDLVDGPDAGVGAVAVQPGGRILLMTRRGGMDGMTVGIRPQAAGPTISPPYLLPGGIGIPYTYQLSSLNGAVPFSYGIASGSLPPGLSLSTGGAITGTPTTAGRYRFIVRVNDSLANQDSRFYTLDIHTDTSLIHEAYRTILGREPDGGGVAFWESEVDRVVALGADSTDALHAMTVSFFASAEFQSRTLTDRDFVTYLYRTYLGREPDAPGLDFWVSQIAQGLPRGSIMNTFLFTPEFDARMARIFGERTSRAEVRMLVDFYRGILGRLPDSGGFQYWLGRFRAAQCNGTVAAEADAISALFLSLDEYAARQAALPAGQRNSAYMVDLYNAFLRRGADVSGFNFWVGQLNGGRSRDSVRRAFVDSPEFQARVQSVIAQGCMN